jgi:hypothetical protein
MANINDIFQLVQYRANKSGFLGNISPNDFNLIFPRAEIKYFNSLCFWLAGTRGLSPSPPPRCVLQCEKGSCELTS